LQALEPAAIEARLALADNLEAERAPSIWRRGAREPTGGAHARARLGKALTEQARLEAEHERVRRARKEAHTAAELAAIRDLSQDLPALWRADTTTQAERQTIVRLLVERVLVEVADATGKVRVECHWHGGVHTRHELTRPVARVASLSTYAALTGRATELRRERPRMREDLRDPQCRRMAPGQAPRHLQCASGFSSPAQNRGETIRSRRRPPQIERLGNEWTIRELAHEIGSIPTTTTAFPGVFGL
jgi:hypothetical protein